MTTKTLKPIAEFNEIAGFPKEPRGIYDKDVLFQKGLIEEEFNELTEAMKDGNISEVLKEAADLIVVTSGLIHRLGYDADEVMDIVNSSNMSKFCDTEDEAIESVNHIKANDGDRYTDVHYEKVGNRYVIYGTPVGKTGKKILKGCGYWKVRGEHFKSD